MKRISLGLSAAVLFVSSIAMAQDRPQPAQPETRAEAQARAGRLFDKLDLNHDGKLDQADRALRSGQMFDRLDTNHDGAISRDEFASQDAHGEGPEHGGPDHDADDGHPGGERHGGGHMGHWGYDHHEMGGLIMLILHQADPTHSGTVTRDGFVNAAMAMFDQADTNHDGILTPDEHRAAAQAIRAQFAHGGPGGDMPHPPVN